MGDSLYGTDEGKAKSDRLLLHARRLSFPHVRVQAATSRSEGCFVGLRVC